MDKTNWFLGKTKINILTFGTKNIADILADREFGSGHLFAWLNKRQIPFYIRINVFGMEVEIFGQGIYLAGSHSGLGELMIVTTNKSLKNAIAIYLCRWEIEFLFCCLKSRGFYFESTHLTHLDRCFFY